MVTGQMETSAMVYEACLHSSCTVTTNRRDWFAVHTLPQYEQTVLRHMELRQVDAFLPTFEITKVWRNRQRVKQLKPIFPTYLFVRISLGERGRVLQSPGVLRIVGNSRGPIPIPSAEIETLRSPCCIDKLEQYNEIPTGARVRIKSGPLQGVQGHLVAKKSGLRFVMTVELINQSVAIEIAASDVEPIVDAGHRASC
jgi:transcription antitermination factor NusG